MDRKPSAITIAVKYRAARAALQLERLLVLDDLWTHHLQSVTTLSNADAKVVERIGRELDTLLAKSIGGSRFAEGLIDKQRSSLDQEWRRILKGAGVTSAALHADELKMRKRGGFAAAMLRLARGINEGSVSRERATLSKKMRVIKDGGFTKGDVSTSFGCQARGTLLVFCILTENFFGAANVYSGMRRAGCFD